MCVAEGNRSISIWLSFRSKKLRSPRNIDLVVVDERSAIHVTNFFARLKVCAKITVIKSYHDIVRGRHSKILDGPGWWKRHCFDLIKDLNLLILVVPERIGYRITGRINFVDSEAICTGQNKIVEPRY